MDFTSKWYDLSDKIAGLQNTKDLGQVGSATNFGVNSGIGALGFRGNNNSGSMERLATQGAMGQAAGGLAAGQSKYNNLAQMYGEGLQKIELPTLQGRDMANALNAGRGSGLLSFLG
jgi:hypothetical protein